MNHIFKLNKHKLIRLKAIIKNQEVCEGYNLKREIDAKGLIFDIVRILPMPELINKIPIGSIYSLYIDEIHIYLGLTNSIQIWNKHTIKRENTLENFDDLILSLFVDKDFIYSGTRDNLVKVWSKDHKHVITISNHKDAVRSIIADEKFLYTGSDDGTIRVWNKYKWDQVGIIRKDFDFLLDMIMDDKYIYIAADSDIFILDRKSFQIVRTLKEHKDDVEVLAIDDKYLYSYSDDTTVKIWDKNEFTLQATIETGGTYANGLTVDDEHIYTTGNNNQIYVWDKKTLSKVFEFQAHDSDITKLIVDDHNLYSASIDGTLKIWPTFLWKDSSQIEQFLNDLFDYGSKLTIDDFEDYNSAIWVFNLCKKFYEKKGELGDMARKCLEAIVPEQIRFLEKVALLDVLCKNRLDELKVFIKRYHLEY